VGEVWEDASNKIAYSVRRRYFLGDQLDSVTNYPLRNAIISCVKEGNVAQLANTMAILCRNYPSHILNGLMNILGTHDTMRILTVLGGENHPQDRQSMSKYRLSEQEMRSGKKLLKLATTLQFTLPGVPCVFYGDEAGIEGGADPFCRVCYPWGKEDHALLSWYTELNRVRKSHSSFKEGKYTLVEAREGLFAFVRGEGAQSVLVAVNVSDFDRVISAKGYNFNVLTNEYTESLVIKAWQPGIYSIKA
jgi:glycosidase